MVEIRKAFHSQLDEISQEIVLLAARVIEFIPRGTEVLLTGDLHKAQELIDEDDVLDTKKVEIEEKCYSLLTRQQPMARDMRTVVTALQLVSEIERSGDLMVNVCKAARRIYQTDLPAPVRGLITTMAEQAARLFRLATDAYLDQDASLAAALDDIDDELDEAHRDYIEAIFQTQGSFELNVAVQLALIGRFYERIGDHAVNIGERVRYMVDGWLPEHDAPAEASA